MKPPILLYPLADVDVIAVTPPVSLASLFRKHQEQLFPPLSFLLDVNEVISSMGHLLWRQDNDYAHRSGTVQAILQSSPEHLLTLVSADNGTPGDYIMSEVSKWILGGMQRPNDVSETADRNHIVSVSDWKKVLENLGLPPDKE